MLGKSTCCGLRWEEGRRGEKTSVNNYENCANASPFSIRWTCLDEYLLKVCASRQEKADVCHKSGAFALASNAQKRVNPAECAIAHREFAQMIQQLHSVLWRCFYRQIAFELIHHSRELDDVSTSNSADPHLFRKHRREQLHAEQSRRPREVILPSTAFCIDQYSVCSGLCLQAKAAHRALKPERIRHRRNLRIERRNLADQRLVCLLKPHQLCAIH